MSVYSVDKLMAETRRLAAEYRRATGSTLPVTTELANYDAVRLLEMQPAPKDAVGYDAFSPNEQGDRKIQIKGRVIFDEQKGGQRLGQINTNQEWDSLLLVLMDENYETNEIHELERDYFDDMQEEMVNSKRNKRGAMSVARFKIVGRLIWSREHGLEDDGYWDNQVHG